MNSKKAFAAQSLFAILMAIVFVGILYYGYTSLISIQDTLSDEEIAKLREEIISRTNVCLQESQKGRFETIEIDIPQITHVCYLKDKSVLDATTLQQLEAYGIFKDSTVVLLNGPSDVDFNEFNDISRADEFIIYDIIPLEESLLHSPENGCTIQENKIVTFKFEC